MRWQYTPYLLPLAVAAVVTVGVGLYAWRRRPAAGAAGLAGLCLAVTEWLLAYALQVAGTDWATKTLWARVRYIGIVAVPLAWVAFALEYTGRTRRLTRRTLALLSIEPLTVLLLVWTNAHHNLIWKWTDQTLDTGGPFPSLHAPHGVAFWGHAVYSYTLTAIGVFLLVRYLFRAPRLYRAQSGMVLLGMLFPLVANLLSTFWDPIPYLDLTPFAFSIGGLVMAWGAFRFRLLDIVPVARDMVIESMGDGLIVLDAQNRVVDLNPALAGLLESDPSALIGRPAAEVLAPYGGIAGLYRDARQVRDELALYQGGEQRYFDLQVSPLLDRRGRLAGRLVVLRDITERKQAEKTLQQAKEGAEAANRAKSEFISVVSHELNTPVTTIYGYADLLLAEEAGPLGEEQKELLRIIRNSALRMNLLISDLADISRIEAGGLRLEPAPVRVAGVVEEVVLAVRGSVEAKGQHLSIEVPPDLPPVWADRPRLVQILFNLVGNAAKFTPQGGRIVISAGRESDGQKEVVRIAVADNGIGIPPEEQGQVFEKFVRSRDAQVRKLPGSGLGLSIARGLVELQGGRIWLESAPGRGTTVHFTLPPAPPDAGQAE